MTFHQQPHLLSSLCCWKKQPSRTGSLTYEDGCTNIVTGDTNFLALIGQWTDIPSTSAIQMIDNSPNTETVCHNHSARWKKTKFGVSEYVWVKRIISILFEFNYSLLCCISLDIRNTNMQGRIISWSSMSKSLEEEKKGEIGERSVVL